MQILINNGKPVLLILNRCDQWESKEIEKLVQSIRGRLPNIAKSLAIETVSAAPRKAKVFSSGRVRSQECESDVYSLKNTLLNILETQGHTLLTLNTLRQADSFHLSLKSGRLKRRQSEVQGLIGKFAALKASGIAINPLLIFDLATGMAFARKKQKIKISKAEKFIKRAVELMPEDPIVNDHYGDILWMLDRKIQARYFCNNVIEM